MFAGAIKKRKRKQKNLQDVITDTEQKTEITAVQTIQLDDFAAIVNTLDGQTVDKAKKEVATSLNGQLAMLKKMSTDDQNIQFNNILAVRNLLQKMRSLLRQTNTPEAFKQPLLDVVATTDKEVNKIVDKIIAIRTRAKAMERFNNDNVISQAALNIQQKILNVAIPGDSVGLENLKRLINAQIISVRDKLTDLDRQDVIKMKVGDETYFTPPSPAKFFYSSPLQKYDSSIVEHQLSSIQQFYQLMALLNLKIEALPNMKRALIPNVTRSTNAPKYPKKDFIKMKDQMLDIVRQGTLDMAFALLRDSFDLIKERLNANEVISNVYATSFIKQGNKYIFVYDALEEVLLEANKAYSPIDREAYKMLVLSMYQTWTENVLPLLDGQNIKPERLLLMRAVNLLFRIEEKIQINFVMAKQALAQNSIAQGMVNDYDQKIMMINKILAEQKKPQTVVNAVNSSLDYILKSMDPKPRVKVEEVRDETEEINQFVSSLKDVEQPMGKLQRTVIKEMHKEYGNKLKLAFYKNILCNGYYTKFLLHFSGFFQIYANVYGYYNRNVYQDLSERNNSLAIWRASRIDLGEMTKQYRKFLELVIRAEYVLFQNKRFKFKNLTDEEKRRVNGWFMPVQRQYEKVIEENKKVQRIQEEATPGVCMHIALDEQMTRVYDLLENEPDNEELKNELQDLLAQKNECTIETDRAIICKHCNVQLDVLLSDEPARYEDVQDAVDIVQRQYILDASTNFEENALNLNTRIATRFLDSYTSALKINVVEEVSEFSDDIEISQGRITEIKDSIVNTIQNHDSLIFNHARSFFIKGSRGVDKNTMKHQLIHDIIKFLSIFYLLREVQDLPLKTPCDEHKDDLPRFLQCLYGMVQPIFVSVSRNSLSTRVRLNYLIKVYNISLDILKSSQLFSYPKDKTEITEETLDKLDEQKIIVVAQDFGLKVKTRQGLKVAIGKSKEVEINDISLDMRKIVKQYFKKLQDSYQKNLERLDNTLVYAQSNDLIEVLIQYMIFVQKRDNMRALLNVNNINKTSLNRQLRGLQDELLKTNKPAERLSLERNIESVQMSMQRYEENKILVEKRNKELAQDQEDVDTLKKYLDAQMFVMDKMNIINLHQHAMFMEREENESRNPKMQAYLDAHKDLNLIKRVQLAIPDASYKDIQRSLLELYQHRVQVVKQNKSFLEFLKGLKDASKVFGKEIKATNYISLDGKDRHFILSTGDDTVKVDSNIMKHMQQHVKAGIIEFSYSSFQAMLNYPEFQNMVLRDLSRFDITDLRDSLLEEQKSYAPLEQYIHSLKHVLFLCPVCPNTDTHNINIKIHLAKHKISSADNLRSISPISYTPEMKWINGSSPFSGNYQCPYCPYRYKTQKRIFNHIKEYHMNLSASQDAFVRADEQRYNQYLIDLLAQDALKSDEKAIEIQNKIDDMSLTRDTLSTINKLNRQIGVIKNKHIDSLSLKVEQDPSLIKKAQKIDDNLDSQSYYVLFCDENQSEFTTMRHVYIDNVCIYCKRSPVKVRQDASKVGKRVKNLVKLVEKRLTKLNEHYCLLNHYPDINKTEGCAKRQGQIKAILDGNQPKVLEKLYHPDISWEMNRKLTHTPFRVAQFLTNVVERYKDMVGNYYRDHKTLPYKQVSLYIVDQLHEIKANEKHEYRRKVDKDYVKQASMPYRNLGKETKQFIFEHKNVKQLEKEIKEHQETNEPDAIKYNLKMNKLVTRLRQEISKAAMEYLKNKAGSTSKRAFVQDLKDHATSSNIDHVATLNNLGKELIETNTSEIYMNLMNNVLPGDFATRSDKVLANNLREIMNKKGLFNEEMKTVDMMDAFNREARLRMVSDLPRQILLHLALLKKEQPKKMYWRRSYVLDNDED